MLGGQRLERANRIARKVWKKYHSHVLHEFPLSQLPPLGVYRKTKVFCSGWCCGNPRKWFGKKTRQEICAELDNLELEMEESYLY